MGVTALRKYILDNFKLDKKVLDDLLERSARAQGEPAESASRLPGCEHVPLLSEHQRLQVMEQEAQPDRTHAAQDRRDRDRHEELGVLVLRDAPEEMLQPGCAWQDGTVPTRKGTAPDRSL